MHFDIYCTFWALAPALIAILMALKTKEVYSSLFCGIMFGALLYAVDSHLEFKGFLTHIITDGFAVQLSNSYNVGILLFLIVLGAMVVLMNRAGGAYAFGEWMMAHVKSRRGVQLGTIFLGMLIFIDDYFNCLTVGSVMTPVADRYKISRAKLAYLVDSTAAPICIIAPISSWAAAVSGFVADGENGFSLFIKCIPYNFYALLTIVAMIAIVMFRADFGPMRKAEAKVKEQVTTNSSLIKQGKGTVFELMFPIVSLIVCCAVGLLYSGGCFSAGPTQGNLVDAFAASNASVGLSIGSFGALMLTVVVFRLRKVMSFKECMDCIPEGFKSMVPAIMILTLAWTLKSMTDSLGAAQYVASLIANQPAALSDFLPAFIFSVSIFLAFATGTSWGTFGILIPICLSAFPGADDPIRIMSISACMAGAVCGDHISPISDTTIMSSTGTQCFHMQHVTTQMPYAMSVALVSLICFALAGVTHNPILPLVLGTALIILAAANVRKITKLFTRN